MSALPSSAVDNADLLRGLSAGATADDLFKKTERRKDSVVRSMKRLEEDGLLTGHDSDTPALTAAGVRARLALDVAEGVVQVSGRAVAVLHADCTPHPDNPRKAIDPGALEQLADTIEEDGGDLIEPLVVGRAGGAPDGKRFVYAGERRWRAVGLLIAQGRRAAEQPVEAQERDDEPGLIFSLSLVENGQRENLTELERARALHALGRSRNWKAPKIAQHTGIDLRTVQQSLQVVEKASPEALAAYDTDGNWEKLRASVQERRPKPSLDLTPKMALPLIELAWKLVNEARGIGDQVAIGNPAPGGAWHTLRDQGLIENVFIGDGKRYAKLGAKVVPWLAEIGWHEDAEGVVLRAREAVVGALEASTYGLGRYVTEWLNAPAPAAASTSAPAVMQGAPVYDPRAPLAEEPSADASVAAYAELAGKTLEGAPSAAAPPAVDLPSLSAEEALILVEVARKISLHPVAAPGRGFNGATAGRYQDDRTASGMVMTQRVLIFVTGPKNTWLAAPSSKGWAWLEACGLGKGLSAHVRQSDHERVLAESGVEKTLAGEMAADEVYATDWLRPVEPAAIETSSPQVKREEPAAREQDQVAPVASEPSTTAHRPPEAETASARLQEARMVLDDVRASSSTTPSVLAALFLAAGVTLPLTVSGGAELLDASGALVLTVAMEEDAPEDLDEARAVLVARAIHAACGLQEVAS